MTLLLLQVVRSSKRIVQAASSFQLGGDAKLITQCHHDSEGDLSLNHATLALLVRSAPHWRMLPCLHRPAAQVLPLRR